MPILARSCLPWLMNALIGHTGFVGSNLRAQQTFDAFYRSSDIGGMAGENFDLVVCAGVQAQKWWAIQHPDEDWSGIQRLLDALSSVRVETMVLISTVDVLAQPSGATELTPMIAAAHAYGRHRFAVEEFVRTRFPRHHVLRLPGLFGTGLKKNVIFDLLHENQLTQMHPGGIYQYYWLEHLSADIEKVRGAGLPLLHLATEPIGTGELIDRFFPDLAGRIGSAAPPAAARYDLRTEYSDLWECPAAGYLYDRATVLCEISQFIARSRTGAPA